MKERRAVGSDELGDGDWEMRLRLRAWWIGIARAVWVRRWVYGEDIL